MTELFGKPRRPVVPKFETLFQSAQDVSDAVLKMRADIIEAEKYCALLEAVTQEGAIPRFDAVNDVTAAVAKLRADITAASEYCGRIEKLTNELRIPSVVEDDFKKPRLLTEKAS